MTDPLLIDKEALQQIADFKLMLRDILLSKASNAAKIAMGASLRQTLRLTLHRREKQIEQQSLLAQFSTKIDSSSTRVFSQRGGEQTNVLSGCGSAIGGMRMQHKMLMNEVCSRYQMRNHFSIELHQLQKQIAGLSFDWQKQDRHHQQNQQAHTLTCIRQAHRMMKQLLNALSALKHSISVQHEMIRDNINLLKVKNSTLKMQLASLKQPKPIKNVFESKGINVGLISRLLNNENRNQILVNL